METVILSKVWVAAAMGAVGAVANCIIIEGGFTVPRRVAKDAGKVVLDVGFIGTILLGAIAAVATYLLGTSELPLARQLGISVVVGVGGGNVLTSLSQKQEAQVLKLQMDALEAALREALGKR